MSQAFDPYETWLGIAPQERPAHAYRLLGLTLFETDAAKIEQQATERMAEVRKWQGGVHGDASQTILTELAQARVCLLDAARRAEYDARLKEFLAGTGPLPTTKPRTASGPAVPVAPAAASPTAATSASAPAKKKNPPVEPSAKKPLDAPAKTSLLEPAPQSPRLPPLATAPGNGNAPAMTLVVLSAGALGLVVLIGLALFVVLRPNSTPPIATPTVVVPPVPAPPPKIPTPAPPLPAWNPGVLPMPVNPATTTNPPTPATPAKKPITLEPKPATTPPTLAQAPFDAAAAQRHQDEWAKALDVPREFENHLGMRFVLIPPGEFDMGSPENDPIRMSSEKLHRVRITRPYYLGMHEVTQAQYEQVMRVNPSAFSPKGIRRNAVRDVDTSRLPVERVDFFRAELFCEELGQADHNRYRLPTEAEWEYACRAGTTTRYPFGDAAGGSHANLDASRPYGVPASTPLERTQIVGTYDANAFGLFDMVGNVNEWCRDFYRGDFYGSATGVAVDPFNKLPDPDGNGERITRGGSSQFKAAECRSATRWFASPSSNSPSTGFRVAIDLNLSAPMEVASVDPAPPSPTPPDPAPSPPDPAPPLAKPPPEGFAVAPFDEAAGKRFQADWAAKLKVPVVYKNGLGMRLVLIPPGEFKMGSPRATTVNFRDEEPQHAVRITKPFYLGMYEITQDEYEKVTGENNSNFRHDSHFAKGVDGKRMPVESVTSDDAQQFCRRLSARDNKKYRLPTEAEWEYACRAGTTTAFSSGDTLTDQEAAIKTLPPPPGTPEPPRRYTMVVGSFKPNAFSLYDMHGNVAEWCSDWYDSVAYKIRAGTVAYDPFSNPRDKRELNQRGGSWSDLAPDVRSARRGRMETGARSHVSGIRVLLEIEEP